MHIHIKYPQRANSKILPLLSGLVLAIGVVAGCTLTGDETVASVEEAGDENSRIPQAWDGHPWAEMFDTAWENGNDFSRGALIDGEITASEVQEANARLVDCLESVGIRTQLESDPTTGLQQVTAWTYDDPELMAIAETCYTGYGDIYWIYQMIVTNPNNEDWSTTIAACMVRHGFAPAGWTAHDFDELNRLNSSEVIDGRQYFDGIPAEEHPYASFDNEQNLWVVDPSAPIPEQKLPDGSELWNSEATNCISNPQW